MMGCSVRQIARCALGKIAGTVKARCGCGGFQLNLSLAWQVLVHDRILVMLAGSIGGPSSPQGSRPPAFEESLRMASAPICNFDWSAVDFDLPATDARRYKLSDVRGPNGLLVMFI